MKPWKWCFQKEYTQPRHKINDGVGINEEECDNVTARLDSVNLYGDHDDDDVYDILDHIPCLTQETKTDDSRFFVDVEDNPLLFKNLDPYSSGNNVDIKNLFEGIEESDGTRIYDIDANVEKPLLCPEIAQEVIKSLRSMEVEKRATNNDVATQIDRSSRAKCVHRLIEAAQMLKCAPTTLHLAVNYFDRYSSGNPTEIKDLEMVALTCLIIASKFNGVASEFDFHAYVVLGGGFCKHELVGMEDRILRYLEYDVMVPTAYSFLERFVGAAQCGRHAPLQGLEGMAARVAEVSLFSTTVLRSFLPSMVAASSVLLAQYVLDPSQKPWNATLRHYTMYEASDLQDCVLALHNKWCTILEKNHAARSKLSDDPVQILFVDPVTIPRTNKLKEVLSGLIQEDQEKELRLKPIERDDTKIPTKIKDYSRVISRKFILLLFNFRDLDRFMLLFLNFLVFAVCCFNYLVF